MSMYLGYGKTPNITQDGLVLYLDAGSVFSYRSYVGGTTWRDLSPNGYSTTLLNGPTYNTTSSGVFTFDGTDDRVDCGTNFSSVITGTGSFTIETWVYPENVQNQYNNIWGNHTDNVTGIVLQQNASNLNQYSWGWGNGISWGSSGGSNVFNINTQQWNHLVALRNGTSVLTYLNGTLIDSVTNSSNIAPNVSFNFQIGNGYNPWNPRLFRGRIGSFRIYSKGLSNAEVSRNFNATRSRFGI